MDDTITKALTELEKAVENNDSVAYVKVTINFKKSKTAKAKENEEE